mmetsp:Transcript_30915/g.82061  ORF Transcript_30915/g.82061 Transcript_30915/m.82061 type:complete len:235 (+) Transcript_30915:520-1224(+)
MTLCWRSPLSQHLLPLLFLSALDQCCALWLCQHYFDVGPGKLQHLGGAAEGAACAIPSDIVIQTATCEVREDLWTCGLCVVRGVGRVLELSCQQPSVFCRQLLGFLGHTRATESGGREDDLRAEHAHDFASFHGERVGHGRDEPVATLRTHHGKGDPSVATGGLHDGAAKLEFARALGIFDNCNGHPVLHGPDGVEELTLHIQVHTSRCQAIDLNHWSPPNHLSDVVVHRPAAC